MFNLRTVIENRFRHIIFSKKAFKRLTKDAKGFK